MEHALEAKLTHSFLAESLLQSYLFVGYPRVWSALFALRRIASASGVDRKIDTEVARLFGDPGTLGAIEAAWWRRGEALCRRVYGPQYPRLRENLGQTHPELADWMILEGYGKVLSRRQLSIGERELWILPILVVQDARDQLHSHVRGALRLGVRGAAIGTVIDIAGSVATVPAWRHARGRLAELTPPRSGRVRSGAPPPAQG